MTSNSRLTGSPATIVVGLGVTGLSCARFLSACGEDYAVTDSRSNPPHRHEFEKAFPDVPAFFGALDEELLCAAGRLILSPGIGMDEPAIVAAGQRGVEIIGDVELFGRHVTHPVIGITGSNGKSTVTTLVGDMARRSGRRVGVGGNLGVPVLDLLADADADLTVLELSSFQLETTYRLNLLAATVLNISADHLDRHVDMATYAEAKRRIFAHADTMVLNADDPVVMSMAESGRNISLFGLKNERTQLDFSLRLLKDGPWLSAHGEPWLAVSELRMRGWHNVANALAALALGSAAGFDREAMLASLREFAGLAHRCQWVAQHQGVDWFDDSKGTNVGATCAAIEGLGRAGQLVLIAGGDGKGQDFSALASAARHRVRAAVVIGRDGPAVAAALQDVCAVERASSMAEAVSLASAMATSGDAVLLSPACSSLDMFANYVARGQAFKEAIARLTVP